MQRGACMSHVSKKSRLNKPLSIYTPPLLQQLSHQAQAVHQSNRLSTLLKCKPIPRSALATGLPPFPPPSPFLLFRSPSAATVFLPRFGKLIPVTSGLGRKPGHLLQSLEQARCAKSRLLHSCQIHKLKGYDTQSR